MTEPVFHVRCPTNEEDRTSLSVLTWELEVPALEQAKPPCELWAAPKEQKQGAKSKGGKQVSRHSNGKTRLAEQAELVQGREDKEQTKPRDLGLQGRTSELQVREGLSGTRGRSLRRAWSMIAIPPAASTSTLEWDL